MRGTIKASNRLSCGGVTGVSVSHKRIVAVGLLTQQDLNTLGPSFDRAWQVDETPCFSQLLRAIDEADRQIHRDRDREG
jgi:hypothetical protein